MVMVKVTNKSEGSAEVSVNGGAFGAMGVWYDGEGKFFTIASGQDWGNPSMRHATFDIKVKIDNQEQAKHTITAQTWRDDFGENCYLHFTKQGLVNPRNNKVLQQFTTYTPFFLASTTEDLWDASRDMILNAGGRNATGVAEDFANKEVLAGDNEGGDEKWKDGMFVKWTNVMDDFSRQYPGKTAIAICITGGPACDWERKQCTDPNVCMPSARERHFRRDYPYANGMQLKMFACSSLGTLKTFLDNGLPLSQCI